MQGEVWSADTEDEAIVWALRLSGMLAEPEAEALKSWLANAPHRLKALARQMAALADVVETNLTTGRRPQILSRRRFLSMAVAVAGGIAAVGGGWRYLHGRHRYETAVGEMGHVLLPDGSMAILNTATEITLRFTPTERHVRLVRGEALFDVELDALRLFSVEAPNLLVQTHGVAPPTRVSESHAGLGALIDYARDIARPLTQEPSRAGFEARGTTFSTRIKPGGRVEVAMVEGGIEFGRPTQGRLDLSRLNPGHVLTVFRDGRNETRPVDPKALENKLSWLERGVVFGPGDTVSDGVTEFNRYNRLRLVVDGRIAARQLRGKFLLDQPLVFVRTLEQVTGARVEVGDRVVTITD